MHFLEKPGLFSNYQIGYEVTENLKHFFWPNFAKLVVGDIPSSSLRVERYFSLKFLKIDKKALKSRSSKNAFNVIEFGIAIILTLC